MRIRRHLRAEATQSLSIDHFNFFIHVAEHGFYRVSTSIFSITLQAVSSSLYKNYTVLAEKNITRIRHVAIDIKPEWTSNGIFCSK